MNVEQAHNKEEYLLAVDTEKAEEEIARLKKSPHLMSRVALSHKYGLGECPCSNCKN